MMRLKELIESGSGEIKKCGTAKRPVGQDGRWVNADVYLIPLKYLYFNDQNDRIGVSRDAHSEEFDKYDLNKLALGENRDYEQLEEYNKMVARHIRDSNIEKWKSTTKNIKLRGQIEPGVVTNSGRV